MRPLNLIAILTISLLCINYVSAIKTPFKHVILLCMENHSYDNMLGFMKAPIGDLDGSEV